MTTVSVLMPVFNAADTIEETLATLQMQTYDAFEVVLVDDGCTDDTIDRATRFWSAPQPLRVIRAGRVGIVGALQAGFAQCKGALIARMDADDRAAPGRLAKQVAFLEQHPAIAICSCLVETFASTAVGEGYRVYENWLNALVDNEAILRERFVESPLAHPSVMMRRKCIGEIGGYIEAGWPEDYDLWLRAAHAGLRFGKVPEVLLYWRDHSDRLSRQDPRYDADAFLRCKVHYLAMGPLAGRAPTIIWGGRRGAGQLGRRLRELGVPIRAYIDIDPRRIGGERGGVPVWGPGDLAAHRGCTVLAAVGTRGARDLIRTQVAKLGWCEGRDFYCVA